MPETNWELQRSIVLEISAAVNYLTMRHLHLDILDSFKPIYDAVPSEWYIELDQLNQTGGKIDSALEILGQLADAMVGDDYQLATLKIRHLTLEDVNAILLQKAAENGIVHDQDQADPDRMIELAGELHKRQYDRFGLISTSQMHIQHKKNFLLALSILSGQKAHDRFWHWMDRFFYQAYQPWRISRKAFLDEEQFKAELALGSSSTNERIPSLEWLDSKNVLNRIPELNQAVRQQQLKVTFWVEPFGLADTWLLTSDRVFVSFASPGEIFQQFAAYNQHLAERISALSDPTRLLILRIIRNFSMTNTDMAEFLGISRPTVSIHAKILREAGFIDSTQDGRITRHVIKPEALRDLIQEIINFMDLPED